MSGDGLAVVDAPTALTGFLLALRLPRYRCRNARSGDGRWRVSIELVDEDRLPALIEAVEGWLEREQIPATEVRVGEHVHRLTAGAARPGARASAAGGGRTC